MVPGRMALLESTTLTDATAGGPLGESPPHAGAAAAMSSRHSERQRAPNDRPRLIVGRRGDDRCIEILTFAPIECRTPKALSPALPLGTPNCQHARVMLAADTGLPYARQAL